MILMIDNYDSFTYNVYQMIGGLNPDIRVVRNDAATVEELLAMNPSHLVISPGPGFPADAGVSIPAIRAFAGKIPVLGICLGHQALAECFGGTIVHAPAVMHGKISRVSLDTGCPLFAGMPDQVPVGRYHSLVARPEDLPDTLKVTARTGDGVIMGLQYGDLPVFGVQFHPESVLTPQGVTMFENFVRM